MKKLLLLLLMAIVNFSFAQSKLNYEFGNFDLLRDQTEVNVQFKFENPAFQVENYTEAQYLERRKAETLTKKDEVAWQKWRGEWNRYRESVFFNKFIDGLNAKTKKIRFGKDLKTKYTLVVETKWIYAGWAGGMMVQPAKLSTVITFVDHENPSQAVTKIQTDKIEGIGVKGDYIMEYGRIAAAYEKTGRQLTKEINKMIK
ncbi:hypothetical protein [Chryseobacterium indologenes]|uniref:hypothetical protein n=1 Tax=Chryseobacterium indologenes TaxID=253 RepID=UPI000F4EE0B9|nr:hypothetical protein [Chryseobacterium indologenes]AYY84335.1 hypothetical protein EGX91_07125 [Chryseobacterium indologenes]QIX81287.1 hypothetical protein FOB56_08570 [Chryseobacterium indologenes]UDQ55030.1 hypothetical protein LJF28_05010 [Chryseobacterium indologenes]